MSSYNPPTENLPTFNSSLFNQPEETLSQAEADKLYLSKTKNDTSTATTTFQNNVTIGVRGLAQGVVTIYRRMRLWDIDNNQQTYGDLFGQGNNMVYQCRNDSATPATSHQFYTRGAGSATDNLQMTIANGTTTLEGTLSLNATSVSVLAPNATSMTLFSGYNNSASLFPTCDTGTITIGNPTFPGGIVNFQSIVRLRNSIVLHRKE